MKRLLSYMKHYKKESIFGPLFKMLEASFELFVPLVVASMVDRGIGQGDGGYVLRMGGLLVALGLIGLACSLTAQYFAAKAAVGISTALRNDLFAHIGGLSYREIDQVGTATLITRMTSDINQVQNGVNMTLRLLLRSPFVVFGAMVMAFTVDVPAALVFAVTIPILCAVVFGILLVSMPLYKKVQKQLDRVLLTSRENLLGVRVIRAFNRQENEIRTFDQENGALVRLQVFVGKISALLNPVTYVIINLATVALIWKGGLRVDMGALSQGQVIALVNYMSQILVELVKMANLIILISKAMACMNRVDGVFQVTGSIADGVYALDSEAQKVQGTPAVEFQNVSFTFSGSKAPALSELSFKAAAGETIGIIGGTGSGKTALVNLIPRFYEATQGKVMVRGRDVREYEMKSLRRAIGVVPQRAVLFAGTLRDNMRWAKEDASDEEIYRALEIAQAKDFVDEKGEGLDLTIEQGGKNLSGGQRQRLTIARALTGSPEILILDDSASALDFATDARLRKALRHSTEGMTVFIVSQRAASIKQADRILVLDDGKIVGQGTHKELLKNCGLYREICLSQLTREEVERDER